MINTKDQEIMSIMQEECAECIQAVSKIFRFGFNNSHPDKPQNNREHLAEEVGDLQAMIDLLLQNNIVDKDQVLLARDNKFNKLRKWSSIFYE